MEKDLINIYRYLYFGYDINDSTASYISQYPLRLNKHVDIDINHLTSIFGSVFDEIKSYVNPYTSIVIPISGGWDSRVVLGESLKHFPKTKIKTYSFGVPGQLDFDIGRTISNNLGLNHEEIDLSKVQVSWDKLLKSVSLSPWTAVPDAFYNQYALRTVAQEGDIMLSGFLGGPLTGGGLKFTGNAREQIKNSFVNKQKRAKSVDLLPSNYSTSKLLPRFENTTDLSLSMFLYFYVRQLSYTYDIISNGEGWKGWNIDTGQLDKIKILAPFLHEEWVKFWMSISDDCKVNQSLYLKMMHQNYPELANIPSKYSLGLKPGKKMAYLKKKYTSKFKRGVYRLFPSMGIKSVEHLNYIDFDAAFREREDYIELLDQSINYLNENNSTPWLDIHEIKRTHMAYKANHSNALLLIIGLALNLANEEKKS